MPYPFPDDVTTDQLAAGYRRTDDGLACLFCAQTYRPGHVYPLGDSLVEAELAMQGHVTAGHGSAFAALLALGKKATGLTDVQRDLLRHFHAGLSDRQIQPLAGGVSLSTIRNQRFALREKARQARVFLALMDLLETDQPAAEPRAAFIEIPGKRAADDERFAITAAEFAQMVAHYFPEGPDGRLARFPKKEKRKIAVMIQLLKRFDPARHYTQAEVNDILATASEDHTTLCRFMVDYGFLGRKRDGSEYWVE